MSATVARTLTLVALLPWFPAPAIATTTDAETVRGTIGRRLEEVLERYESYGFSGTVLVALHGEIVLHKGYGLADYDRRIANTPDTVYEMASITKTFTAAAILRLEHQGRLSTADPIGKYLGPFPAPKSAATLEHLLTHTSGLVVDGADVGGDGTSRDRFVNDMKETPMESPPGEHFRYTNAGYSLLAAVIETTSGRSYEQFIREEFFGPAGLTSAGFRGEVTTRPANRARGHLGTAGEPKVTPEPPYLWGTRGAGGLVATVGDIYRWYLALQNDRILPAVVRKRVFAPSASEQYGWHVETSAWGSPVIHKGGGMPDFATQILHYPKEGLVIVWASNDLRQRWRATLNETLPAAALGQPMVLPPAPMRINSKNLAPYAGSYSTTASEVLEVRAGDGFLYFASGPESASRSVRFVPTSRDGFTGLDASKGSSIDLKFSMDRHHHVTGLVLRSVSGELDARRSPVMT